MTVEELDCLNVTIYDIYVYDKKGEDHFLHIEGRDTIVRYLKEFGLVCLGRVSIDVEAITSCESRSYETTTGHATCLTLRVNKLPN